MQQDPATGAYAPLPPQSVAPPSAVPRSPGVPIAKDAYVLTSRGDRMPIGDFFDDDTPAVNWTFDEADREPRVVGTILAAASLLLLVAAFVVYGIELRSGASGALAGGVVVLAMITWISYLSLQREQQHDVLMAWHRRISDRIDRRARPFSDRTRTQLSMRRERDRFRAMRAERNRRINELGEVAYRMFRSGDASAEIVEHGRRVLAIEQQMLMQDARMADIQQPAEVPSPPAEPTNTSEQRAPAPRRRRRRRPRRY